MNRTQREEYPDYWKIGDRVEFREDFLSNLDFIFYSESGLKPYGSYLSDISYPIPKGATGTIIDLGNPNTKKSAWMEQDLYVRPDSLVGDYSPRGGIARVLGDSLCVSPKQIKHIN